MDLHYSQTNILPTIRCTWFYYLMDLHYSQTNRIVNYISLCVLLPYGFTLFSNQSVRFRYFKQFYYLMDLHYSQTPPGCVRCDGVFYYLMDLHYSQTYGHISVATGKFYYLMDLHYSQTSNKLRPLYSAGQIHKI